MHRLLLILILLCTSGCALYPSDDHAERKHSRHTTTPARQHAAPVISTPAKPSPAMKPAASPRQPANSGAATLLQQATQARQAGDLNKAQSMAERAQGIDPRSGHSYLELAHIYEARGDHARARQMALRGLSYAGDDENLKQALQAFTAR